MSIFLNQVRVPGFNEKVSVQLNLAGEDMSGQGSYTPQAETGDKAKEMSVSCQIRMADAGDLKRLMGLAESQNVSGERTIYNVLNKTANAMGMRQVRFQGSVQVREDESLKLWLISFSLIEYKSSAEKKESRAAGFGVGIQAPTGTPVSTLPTGTDLSAFELMIQKASELLR